MAYRIEYSDSSRAKCNGPTCIKEGNKILKGEIRLGTFVDTGQFASFRRAGCTTDQVLANMKKKLDDKFNEIDGFENLKEEDQKAVMEAFEKGSIGDSVPKTQPLSPKRTESKKKAEEADYNAKLEQQATAPVKKRKGGAVSEDRDAEHHRRVSKRDKKDERAARSEKLAKNSAKKPEAEGTARVSEPADESESKDSERSENPTQTTRKPAKAEDGQPNAKAKPETAVSKPARKRKAETDDTNNSPKKTHSADKSTDSVTVDTSAPTKLASKKKTSNSEKSAEAEEGTTSAKRGRGRPRKQAA